MADNALTAEQLQEMLNKANSELATAKSDLATAQKKAETLTAQNADLASKNKELTVTVEKQTKELTEAAKVVSGQTTTINELEGTLAKLQASPQSVPTFVVDKVRYAVDAPTFTYKKVEYTAAQLVSNENKDLQKELVKAGVGFLRIVKD